MGEIDRINPILRPVFGPRATDRVQPANDQHRHHEQPEDRLELSNEERQNDPEEEEELVEDILPEEPEHGLDLSI